MCKCGNKYKIDMIMPTKTKKKYCTFNLLSCTPFKKHGCASLQTRQFEVLNLKTICSED